MYTYLCLWIISLECSQHQWLDTHALARCNHHQPIDQTNPWLTHTVKMFIVFPLKSIAGDWACWQLHRMRTQCTTAARAKPAMSCTCAAHQTEITLPSQKDLDPARFGVAPTENFSLLLILESTVACRLSLPGLKDLATVLHLAHHGGASMATQATEEDGIEMWKIKRVSGVMLLRSGHVFLAACVHKRTVEWCAVN